MFGHVSYLALVAKACTRWKPSSPEHCSDFLASGCHRLIVTAVRRTAAR